VTGRPAPSSTPRDPWKRRSERTTVRTVTRGRPVLLLDIDGVLNPFAAATCPPGYTEHDLFPGEDPVRLCQEHGQWIAELAGLFDVVWASAWGRHANLLVGPVLHVPALPYVDFPPVPFAPAEKVPAVVRHVRDRQAVWIDDVVTPEARLWAAGRGTPTLLIEVDPAGGLTRDTVDRALGWAVRHAAAGPEQRRGESEDSVG
jgi:HAD domain in Swiss Army Knife RNA repair proteins